MSDTPSEREKRKHSSKHKDKDREEKKSTLRSSRRGGPSPGPGAVPTGASRSPAPVTGADVLARRAQDAQNMPVVRPPEDLDAEWSSLNAVNCGDDSDPIVANAIPRVTEDVANAFAEVRKHARRLNLVTARPEIVLVGTTGSGKSALLDAMVGVSGLGSAQPTVRTLVVQTAYAPQERVVFRQDLSLLEHNRDLVLDGLAAIPAQVASRNVGTAIANPMVLQIESPKLLDATYIDTPGLIVDPNNADSAAHEAATLNAIAPANRLIVVVRPAACAVTRANYDYVLDVVKRVDPDYTRTIVVYTQLHEQLRAFQNAKAVNQFLTVTAPDVRTYFVSLPALELRNRIDGDSAKFDEILRKAARRDKLALEQLQYDKRHEGSIGAPAFVQHIVQYVWRAHQVFCPRALEEIRSRKSASERNHTVAEEKVKALTSNYFRVVASGYAMQFLQTVQALLRGCAEGNPAVNGETLDQEKSGCGVDSQWVNGEGQPVSVGQETWDVPMWDIKLFGTQQFERLLAEFRLVSQHLAISDISDDDIATGAGIPALSNTPNDRWAASDIARQKTQEAFVPLIAQLAKRAEYVLCRLASIAVLLVEEQRKQKGTIDEEEAEQYTYFVHFVKNNYTSFIEEACAECKKACMHEFMSTQTIYWDLTQNNVLVDSVDGEGVREIATKLFNVIKTRISSNIITKFYQSLLVPLDAPLWSKMQNQVSELSDESIESLFGAEAIRKLYTDRAKKCEEQAKELAEEESVFAKVAHDFAHPKH